MDKWKTLPPLRTVDSHYGPNTNTIHKKKKNFIRQLTDLESICVSGEHLDRATSVSYKWLQNSEHSKEDGFRRSWWRKLQMNITESQWRNACILSHKGSISTKMQETAYKLLTKWYLTPDRLHRWCPQTPDVCWRFRGDVGTLMHIWWNFSLLTPFWDEVKALIVQITDTSIKLNAACCLLHISKDTKINWLNMLTKHWYRYTGVPPELQL